MFCWRWFCSQICKFILTWVCIIQELVRRNKPCSNFVFWLLVCSGALRHPGAHGPLTRYLTLQVAHARGMPGTLSPPPRVSDPDMHDGTCVTHVPWCMSGSLTSGFLWSRCQGKRSRHSRRMRNPQFYVSGKRPTAGNTTLVPYQLTQVTATHLPHWGRDKMAAIFQATFWMHFLEWKFVWISIEFSLNYVPKSPINNDPALVQIMAWCQIGDKPLPE